jgi:sulfatase modifying factor 1
VAGGSDQDVTDLGIRNLAGNVSEWVADDFAPYDDPCWGPAAGVAFNPCCTLTDGSTPRSTRGGNWYLAPMFALGAVRSYEPPDTATARVGFRCALSR